MPNSITNLVTAPLDLQSLLLNLAIGVVLSLLISWVYVRFGRSLSNRRSLARILPFICLTTILIISVVKSSLALSLGLVGALSIVRFRTPIKEPEELAYLFLAIAVGLGLGADQRGASMVAAVAILVVVACISLVGGQRKDENLFLNIALKESDGADGGFEAVNSVLRDRVDSADLRRLDRIDGELQLTYLVRCRDDATLAATMDALRTAFPSCSVTFVEQQNYLGG